MKLVLVFAAIVSIFLACTRVHPREVAPVTPQRSSEAAPVTSQRSSGVIMVRDTAHPYLIEGRGPPCIIVGLAAQYARLFSDRLKQHVRFIYVQFKRSWAADAGSQTDTTTMATLVDEIDEVRRALRLDRVCVVGHSAPGLVALEYAAKYPDHTSHLILIATPPFHTQELQTARRALWNAEASPDRKAILLQNVERVPDSVLEMLSPSDAFGMRYARTGPKYFYDASYDFYWAWIGQQFSGELLNRFFSTIIASDDPRPRLTNNRVPMFVALGRHDYAVPHYLWDNIEVTVPHITRKLFERSAHFPMLEEVAAFDDALIRWLEASP